METIKTITGISKFLHSETGKKYLARFWPEVKKRLSARGFGRLAANMTLAYKFIDEEAYNKPGNVEVSNQVEPESMRLQEEAAMAESYTETPRFLDIWSKYESVIDGILKLQKDYQIINAKPITAGCRMIKSKAEIAIIQLAMDITMEVTKVSAESVDDSKFDMTVPEGNTEVAIPK